jgi:hypothetical protein
MSTIFIGTRIEPFAPGHIPIEFTHNRYNFITDDSFILDAFPLIQFAPHITRSLHLLHPQDIHFSIYTIQSSLAFCWSTDPSSTDIPIFQAKSLSDAAQFIRSQHLIRVEPLFVNPTPISRKPFRCFRGPSPSAYPLASTVGPVVVFSILTFPTVSPDNSV